MTGSSAPGRSRGRVAARLLGRLLEECPWDLPEDATVCRLYHGRHQRAAGAWSWTVEGSFVRSPLSIGSQYSMAECLAASRLDFSVDRAGNGHIDLEPSHDDVQPKGLHAAFIIKTPEF